MKKTFILICALLCSLSILKAQNADMDINILMQPDTMGLNSNGILNIESVNNGQGSIVANSLRITISVGTNAEIIGVQNSTSDVRWAVESLTSGTNNEIFLKNIGPISGANGATFFSEINLIVKGTVNGGASTITGNISYISANNPLLAGAPNSSQGNSSTNDNSTTSLTVVGVLPIKLSSFTAKANECSTIINWKAADETNLKNYEVEYSKDGRTFKTIETVSSKGSNTNYQSTHTDVQGKVFYRLKAVDNDGKFIYTNTIPLNSTCTKSNVSVYPNPTSSFLNVNLVNQTGSASDAILFNAKGLKLMNIKLQNGNNMIDVKKFSKGNYILQIVKQGEVESIKFVIN